MESQSPKIHQAAEASLAVGFVSNSFLVASFACALAVGCSGQVASSHGAGGASQAGAGGSSTGGAGGSAGSSAGSSSTGGRSGGTGGGSSSCKVDADCSPAACGQCPDGSKACPTTRCMIGFGTPSATGYCTSDPAAC